MWKKLPDNFSFGIVFGIISLFVSYMLMRSVRLAIVNYYNNEYLLAQPRVQLFTILINLIIFRFMMIRFEKENTGKGILFSTVIVSLLYFTLYYRFNYRMP
jgi:hypothetical protein